MNPSQPETSTPPAPRLAYDGNAVRAVVDLMREILRVLPLPARPARPLPVEDALDALRMAALSYGLTRARAEMNEGTPLCPVFDFLNEYHRASLLAAAVELQRAESAAAQEQLAP